MLVFIDDATGKLMTLHFTQTESTFSYFEALQKYLVAHGKPVALYSDKNGRVLPYREYDRLATVDRGAEVENKRLSAALATARLMQAQRDNRRASDAPSRVHMGAQVNAKKAMAGLKKQRAMTMEDFNAAVHKVTEKAEAKRGAAAPPHPQIIKMTGKTTTKPKRTTGHF